MDNQNNSLLTDGEKEYSLMEYFFILKKHYKTILATLSLILFSTVYYTLVSKPIYSSTATIMINEDEQSSSVLDMSFGKNRNHIQNQIEILKSRNISENAVRKLLDSPYRDNLFLFNTKKYNPVWYRNYLTLGLLDRFQILNDSKQGFTENEINLFIKKLNKSMSITNTRNTDALKITIESYNSVEASLLVNTIVDVYRDSDLDWLTGEMSHLKVFLVEQLDKKELELNQVEQRLKEFQEKEKIFALDENASLLLNTLTEFETNYNNSLTEINIINERIDYINNQLSSGDKNFAAKVTNSINDRLSALRSEITNVEYELISTIAKYGDSHSAVVSLKSKLIILKNNITEETRLMISNGKSVANPILFRQSLIDSLIILESSKASLISRSNALRGMVEEYDSKLSLLPEKFIEYTRFQRNRSIYADTYSFMKKKLEEAKIGEASKLGQIRIIDNAIINKNPIFPNKIRNIFIGLLLGLFSGCGLAFIIEFFDNTIKSVEQVERRGLAILAIIPAIGIQSKRQKTKKYLKNNSNVEKLQRRLITHEDPKSPVSEAYRSLRTSLIHSSSKDGANIIMVSSAGPGEGKTTTIANLAITYANLGKKTLLVDSDLRKPVIHNIFKVDKTPGITSFLSGESSISEIINTTEVENLDLITSGVIPPNPSEILDSEKMSSFFETVKNNYDIILFDTPPLIAVTDAYVLMKYIDQFILVIRAGVAEKGAVERVLNAFKQTKFKITGVVINAMSEEHSYGAGYYYNYYQYYYGDNK